MPIVKQLKPERWKDTHRTRLKVRVIKNEIITVYVNPEMTVKELRKYLELATGIPYDIQRLTYLDEAELIDSSTIKENEIVPGATIELTVWYMWSDIVEKAISCEITELMKLGVDPSVPFSSPVVEYMSEKTRTAWIKKRAFVVMCIAANREHLLLCYNILPFVPNLNTRTPAGRTALHIAASQGKSAVIKFLIEKGAKMNILDNDGFLAINFAILFGRSNSEKLISMLLWKDKMEKRKTVKKKSESPKSLKREDEVPEESETATKPEIQETQPDTIPPKSEVVVKQKEMKSKAFAEVRTETEKIEKEDITQQEDNNKQPPDHMKNPESLRNYLRNLKSESKHFGYAASIIDDHLQHLDDTSYHSFNRTELVSEKDMLI